MDEKLDAAQALLTQVIERVPTSAAAHINRSNVRERLGDTAGMKADRKRAAELAALAKKQRWPSDPVEVLKRRPKKVAQADVKEHTVDPLANYYCADASAEHLVAAGLKVKGEPDSLRVVVGVHQKGRSFEAVAFAEAGRGKRWAAATERLIGRPAEKFVEALAKKNGRYEDLKFTFAEVLDGFEEQALNAEELD
jgi:hypothetical protein